MEHLDVEGTKRQNSIRELFTTSTDGGDMPHSVSDASLAYDREHSFQGYGKNKTIDQFTSEEGDTFYRLTGKREVQFITSEVLGCAVNVSPIYIDGKGEYYSKKVEYIENLFDASIGQFLLNIVADDWDHKIPHGEDLYVRNFERGSFFDFSHSKIALESAQNLNEDMLIGKTRNGLTEMIKRLETFAQSKAIDVSRAVLVSEVKAALIEKLQLMLEFVSSEESIKKLYEKIGYFQHYQHDLLPPEDFQELLRKKIAIIVKAVENYDLPK